MQRGARRGQQASRGSSCWISCKLATLLMLATALRMIASQTTQTQTALRPRSRPPRWPAQLLSAGFRHTRTPKKSKIGCKHTSRRLSSATSSGTKSIRANLV
eukprot:26766_1